MLGILAAATGALFAEEAPDATDSPKRIVILGDSITAGYGLDPSEAYPALLQKKIDAANLPYTVSNAGVSGDTTAGGLRRIAWVMGKGADVLIIALGGNDGLRGIPPGETKKNLLGIAEKARTKNPDIQILIAGMLMPDNMAPTSPPASKPSSRKPPKNPNPPSSPSSSKASAESKNSTNPTVSIPPPKGRKEWLKTSGIFWGPFSLGGISN